VKLKEGKSMRTFGSIGYDSDSHCIKPGGFVMLFGFGFLPTILDLAHVKLFITTSAFTATVATRKDRTVMDQVNQEFSVVFLEKSLSDWWAKYVILVSDK
jgi:hypothetical protein